MDEEEDDKAAELEALLEQFREPEEAPRKKSGIVWYLAALILAAGGCWLAIQATKGSILNVKAALAPPIQPAKVKDRSAYYTARENIDAEADYRERCKKGMTAKEVRWIVEDFVQAGLADDAGGLPAEVQDAADILTRASGWKEWNGTGEGDPPPLAEKVAGVLKSKGLQLANRQQRWYADALADGLRLDRPQRKEAYESGRKLVEELGAQFPKPTDALQLAHNGPAGSHESSEEPDEMPSLAEQSEILVPTLWLQDERCAPWEKCQLRDDQMAVLKPTKLMTIAPVESGDAKVSASQGGESPWYEPDRVVIETSRGMEESTAGSAEAGKGLSLPAEPIYPALGVFPFRAEQDKGIPDNDLAGLLKSLHPAQLKMMLLTQPDLAGAAEEALDRQGE